MELQDKLTCATEGEGGLRRIDSATGYADSEVSCLHFF